MTLLEHQLLFLDNLYYIVNVIDKFLPSELIALEIITVKYWS